MKILTRTAALLLVLIAGGTGFLLYRHVLLGHTGSLRPVANAGSAAGIGETTGPSSGVAGTTGSGEPGAAANKGVNPTGSAGTAGPAAQTASAGVDSQEQGGTGAPEASAPAHPVPSILPDVRLPDLAGRQKSLQSFNGQPLIVNFWATWCAPCRREIPLLQKLRREHAADHLEVVGIAVDSRDAVADYVKKIPIDYPLLVGEQQGLDVIQQFGMEAVLPFSVFVASNGQIVALKIGELHADEAEFILATLDRIDKGTQSLPAARADIAQALRNFAIQRARTGAAAG